LVAIVEFALARVESVLSRSANFARERREVDDVWYGIGFGIFFYILLAFTLGLITLRKGHWVMFLFGIFLPIFWIVGALIPPTREVAQPV